MNFKEFPSILPRSRSWGAKCGSFTFVISLEEGDPSWSDEEKDKWVGYTASYKTPAGRDKLAIRIGKTWQSFSEAKKACEKVWQKLRRFQ